MQLQYTLQIYTDQTVLEETSSKSSVYVIPASKLAKIS